MPIGYGIKDDANDFAVKADPIPDLVPRNVLSSSHYKREKLVAKRMVGIPGWLRIHIENVYVMIPTAITQDEFDHVFNTCRYELVKE